MGHEDIISKMTGVPMKVYKIKVKIVETDSGKRSTTSSRYISWSDLDFIVRAIDVSAAEVKLKDFIPQNGEITEVTLMGTVETRNTDVITMFTR